MPPAIEKQMEDNTRDIALLGQDIGYIKKAVDSIEKKIDVFYKNVPSRTEFEDLKTQVDNLYSVKDWGTKIIVGAVIVAMLGLVLR